MDDPPVVEVGETHPAVSPRSASFFNAAVSESSRA
jgi:hypothetical protein